MTINKLAKMISDAEGKKESINIAQIKEIIRVMATIFAEEYVNRSDDAWMSFRDYALKIVEKKEKKLKGKQ